MQIKLLWMCVDDYWGILKAIAFRDVLHRSFSSGEKTRGITLQRHDEVCVAWSQSMRRPKLTRKKTYILGVSIYSDTRGTLICAAEVKHP